MNTKDIKNPTKRYEEKGIVLIHNGLFFIKEIKTFGGDVKSVEFTKYDGEARVFLDLDFVKKVAKQIKSDIFVREEITTTTISYKEVN